MEHKDLIIFKDRLKVFRNVKIKEKYSEIGAFRHCSSGDEFEKFYTDFENSPQYLSELEFR